MDFKELSRVRYPLCEFDNRPIEQDKLDKILEAGRKAPSARNFQSQRVFVLCSRVSLEKINACVDTKYNASVMIIVGYDEHIAWARETDGKNHGEIDASICAMHMMLQALDLGIGASFVVDFDPVKLRGLFPQLRKIVPVAVLPLGYPVETGFQNEAHLVQESIAKIVSFL